MPACYPKRVKVKIIALTAAVLFLIALAAPQSERNSTPEVPQSPADSAPTAGFESTSGAADLYAVTKIVDGDTVVVSINGKDTTIRLIGLDTPEMYSAEKRIECFAEEASAKARELLSGKDVMLEADSSQESYDVYGRTLAYIRLSDGRLFNKIMIEEGYGREYTYIYPYAYQKEFKAAELTARDAGKGLWSACTVANRR